jgi:N-acetylglutamate synthase-like GNAT family acetyltransferase
MDVSNFQTRRATLDDLVELRKLWHQAGFPGGDLEKRLTEFQIAETADGTLLGCIGLQLESQQGKIHSETYCTPKAEDALRPRLWDRIQAVARNHGLCRLWTQSGIPFWRSQGFQQADASLLPKLPAGFGDPKQNWCTLKLREESAAGLSLEREFELFKQSQQDLSDRVLRQARILRVLAGVIAVLVLLLAIWGMWYVMHRLPKVMP